MTPEVLQNIQARNGGARSYIKNIYWTVLILHNTWFNNFFNATVTFKYLFDLIWQIHIAEKKK